MGGRELCTIRYFLQYLGRCFLVRLTGGAPLCSPKKTSKKKEREFSRNNHKTAKNAVDVVNYRIPHHVETGEYWR